MRQNEAKHNLEYNACVLSQVGSGCPNTIHCGLISSLFGQTNREKNLSQLSSICNFEKKLVDVSMFERSQTNQSKALIVKQWGKIRPL